MGLDKSPGAEEIEKILIEGYELISLKNFFLDFAVGEPNSVRVYRTFRKSEIIEDAFWSRI